MNKKYGVFLLSFALSACAASGNLSSTPDLKSNQESSRQTLKLPRQVSDFTLLDHQGKSHQLSYYADKKAIVFVSYGIGCPIARQSLGYLNSLRETFASRGVEFFLIDSNVLDDHASIQKEVEAYKILWPVWEDPSQVGAKLLGLTRTAEAVVIDPSTWTLVYQGAVHDGFNYEGHGKKPTHQFVQEAIVDLLEHRSIAIPSTEVKGCLISFDEKNESLGVDYAQEIVPILVNKCALCHNPGGIAPWSMDSYERVKGWHAMIQEVLQTRRMPPWQADPHVGKFKGDFSLTEIELRILLDWIEQGLPRGTGPDGLLKVAEYKSQEWSLGTPDMIVALPQKEIIPATGNIPYRIIPIEALIPDDVWIRAVDLVPGNRKVVHHCDVVVDLPKNQNSSEEFSEQRDKMFHSTGLKVEGVGQVIAGYAPGYWGPFVLPEGSGFFLPKGSRLTFWMHYVPTGKPEEDQTQLGLYLHKAQPDKVFSVVQVSNKTFKIPPFEKDYPVEADYRFSKDVELYGILPHMHYRGKQMKFTAIYPDGKTEVLLSVPRFKFNWQRRYMFDVPKRIPQGTRILVEGSYDNSRENLDNPDPTQTVSFGPLSEDEMFSGFLYFIEP